MGLIRIQHGSGGLLKFHQGPNIQRGSGLLSFLIKGAKTLLPKIVGASKTALKGIKAAAKSDLGKELTKNLKDVAITTGVDTASKLLSGENPTDVLQEGLERGKSEIALALQKKADQLKNNPGTSRKRKKVDETHKGRKKSRKKGRPSYNLFNQ